MSFGPSGDAFQSGLSFNIERNADSAILVSKSSDGGESWGPNTTLIHDTDPRFSNEKLSITADPTDDRFVYAVWDRLETDADDPEAFSGPTFFSRTSDGGATWSEPRKIYDPAEDTESDASQTYGNQIVVLSNGDFVNVFALLVDRTAKVAVIRSRNRGRSWSDPVIVDELGTISVKDPRDGQSVRTAHVAPQIAADPRRGRRNVYVAWQDARFSGGKLDQIALSRSTDGGRSWSTAKRISANPHTQSFTPALAVSGAGHLGVTYYDFSRDTVDSPTLDTDYWLVRSTNRGRSFSAPQRITPTPFDMRAAPISAGLFLGEHQGLTATRRAFRPLFIATTTDNTDDRTSALTTADCRNCRDGSASPPEANR